MIPESNTELWADIKRRRLRDLLLFADALVGYVASASGTLAVEFILHHQKFMTPEGFREHLFTALGSGLVGSSLYLRQKPRRQPAPVAGGSEDT